MIRIAKPRSAPAILRTRGRQAAREHCAAFDRGEPIEIQDWYHHPSVRAALRKAQHDKCAFCESIFSHIGYGDVEHFRPKAGYQQHEADSLRRPGYYWLAYWWANLFLSCQLCNQRFKGNLFPLENPADRVLSHHNHRRLRYEKPLLLDPGKDDPGRFLTFHNEAVWAINANLRAKTTIEVLGLNRIELIEVRRQRLEHALAVAELRQELLVRLETAPREQRAELTARLKRSVARLRAFQADNAEYAAMMRAALADVRTDD